MSRQPELNWRPRSYQERATTNWATTAVEPTTGFEPVLLLRILITNQAGSTTAPSRQINPISKGGCPSATTEPPKLITVSRWCPTQSGSESSPCCLRVKRLSTLIADWTMAYGLEPAPSWAFAITLRAGSGVSSRNLRLGKPTLSAFKLYPRFIQYFNPFPNSIICHIILSTCAVIPKVIYILQ